MQLKTLQDNKKVNLYRGSENDVLLRFIKASEKFKLENVIRVCADNPLFDLKGTLALTSFLETDEWDYIGYKIYG